MGLDEYLLPGEEIRFQSPTEVEYGGEKYTLYLTNKRLILYKQKGLGPITLGPFKRDLIVTEKIKDIEALRYKEEGIIAKKGIIEINTKTRKFFISGKASQMKALYQALQEYF